MLEAIRTIGQTVYRIHLWFQGRFYRHLMEINIGCVWYGGVVCVATGAPRHWAPAPLGPSRHWGSPHWAPATLLGPCATGSRAIGSPALDPSPLAPFTTGSPLHWGPSPRGALLSFWVVYYTWLVHPVTRHCVRHVQVLVVTWLIS